MNNFYCIYNSKESDSLELSERLLSLENACRKNNINFVLLDEATINFLSLPTPTSNDGLYNCARGSYLLEQVLINHEVKTFYRNYNHLFNHDDTNQLSIELKKQGISTPKTIFKSNNNLNHLREYVEHLNGFPIIVKTYGGTGGIGVIKVDNFATLNSLADYFVGEKINFQLKEFIPSKSCERLTVLGDEVIYAITRPLKTDDFRSNVYDKKSHTIELSDEINQVAIKATHASNLNYAGVDLIISSKDNKPYVLEVNCPQNFAIHEQVTGESCSEKMIAWLFRK